MIRFLSRKEMAELRGISLSSEKRLEKMYPDKYPLMVEISPGRKASTEEDNDRFSRFLIEQTKRNGEA